MPRLTAFALPLRSRPGPWGTALACLAAATVLASCGGGSRVKNFEPSQVIALGDENSAFDAGTAIGSSGTLYGLRYTINATSVTTTYCSNASYPCATGSVMSGTTFTAGGTPAVFALQPNQLVAEVQDGSLDGNATTRMIDRGYLCVARLGQGTWVQTLANAFGSGLTFGGNQCPQDGGNAQSYAAWGAKAADVRAQFNAHRAEMGNGTLVTLLAGQNDIVEAYRAVVAGTLSQDSAASLLAAQGDVLAKVVNDIVATGARAVVLKVPDLGLSPMATNDGQGALMSALVKAFNEGVSGKSGGGLTLGLVNKGHQIVLVETFNLFASLPASVNGQPACQSSITRPDGTPATTDQDKLRYCTSDQLVPGATPTSSLWADATHLSPLGHASLASVAYARIKDQL